MVNLSKFSLLHFFLRVAQPLIWKTFHPLVHVTYVMKNQGVTLMVTAIFFLFTHANQIHYQCQPDPLPMPLHTIVIHFTGSKQSEWTHHTWRTICLPILLSSFLSLAGSSQSNNQPLTTYEESEKARWNTKIETRWRGNMKAWNRWCNNHKQPHPYFFPHSIKGCS